MLGIAISCALACLLAATVLLYERELGRIARFAKRRDRTENERIDVGFPTPGISSVAAAVNGELDALRDERCAMARREEAFRRDLASLSHDIRTPLAGAQGYIQLHGRSSDPEERARCLQEAASRLSAMRELTDRLFDYSKAVSLDCRLDIGPVEVMPVLSEVLAGAYPRFAERRWEPLVRLDDESASVLADEEALARVFSNLLSNSLRYGTSAPSIVQKALSEEGGKTVEISFSNEVDDPRSIDVDRLFERFYRADDARGGGGSGLGLAIVSSLCSKMGGTAAARIEGRELVVSVRLPSASMPDRQSA